MKDAFINRKYVVMALILLAALGLIVRLFIIQVVKNTYRLSADNNVLRYVAQYPARGLIYDRNGKQIVYNQAAYDIMVVPAQTGKIVDTASFCDLLGISRELYLKQMKAAINFSSGGQVLPAIKTLCWFLKSAMGPIVFGFCAFSQTLSNLVSPLTDTFSIPKLFNRVAELASCTKNQLT